MIFSITSEKISLKWKANNITIQITNIVFETVNFLSSFALLFLARKLWSWIGRGNVRERAKVCECCVNLPTICQGFVPLYSVLFMFIN